MGVFGGVNCSPEMLEEELSWIDDHVDGKPYGLDIIVPNKVEGKGEQLDPDAVLASIPDEHKQFTSDIMNRHGVDAHRISEDIDEERARQVAFTDNLRGGTAGAILEVAFKHPIGLVANALGIPPQVMLDLGKRHDVPVAALVGTKEHAMSQIAAGVDIIVAAGGEAGGHTGEISTMVLIPEVCNALAEIGDDTPVLAAGGIATGAQMAAAMAMGAAGEHGHRRHGVDDLGPQHHAADLARVPSALVALGDDDVDARRSCGSTRAWHAATEGGDQTTGFAWMFGDHVLGRRTECVGDHALPCRVASADFDLRRPLSRQSSREARSPASRRPAAFGTSCSAAESDRRTRRCCSGIAALQLRSSSFFGLERLAHALVLAGNDDVDAVRLVAHVFVDPLELDLELFGLRTPRRPARRNRRHC